MAGAGWVMPRSEHGGHLAQHLGELGSRALKLASWPCCSPQRLQKPITPPPS
jgi:hypothetical protein